MTLDSARPDEKAQSGIGTLIILIAAILVATIAVGVFFDIAGLLEGQTASTSEGVSQQLEGRLEVVTVSGTVSGSTVDSVNVTVKLASDDGTVDLRDVTVQWIGPADAQTLTWDGGDETGPTFAVTTYGNASAVLDDETDRATLTIDPDAFGSSLAAEDTVTLTVITDSETVYRIQVPNSVADRSTVSL